MRRHKVSERRACRLVGQHRSAQRYVPMPDDFEARLVKEMRRLAETHPRWGYRQIHALLVDDGWKVNRKRIERLWRLEGLKVPPSKSKNSGRKAGGGAENSIWNLPALYPDHIWTFDFMTDRTVDGQAYRILNIVDEYTRVCVESYVARNIGARRVLNVLDRLFAAGSKPKLIRSDNGREFIASVLELWLKEQGVVSAFVEKGSPQQNAFIESFNAGMRRECLNVEEFHSVLEAKVVIGEHRQLYNTVRRHRGLGMITPAEFARRARLAPTAEPVIEEAAKTGQTHGGSRKRGR
jgi:transposase InsO family protein